MPQLTMWRVMAQIISFFFVVLDFFKMNYDTNNDELRYKLYNFFYNTRLFQGSYDTNFFFFFFFSLDFFKLYTHSHLNIPHSLIFPTHKKRILSFPFLPPKSYPQRQKEKRKVFFGWKEAVRFQNIQTLISFLTTFSFSL